MQKVDEAQLVQTLAVIVSYLRKEGRSPQLSEIQAELGLNSIPTAFRRVSQLKEAGWLAKQRGIRLTEDGARKFCEFKAGIETECTARHAKIDALLRAVAEYCMAYEQPPLVKELLPRTGRLSLSGVYTRLKTLERAGDIAIRRGIVNMTKQGFDKIGFGMVPTGAAYRLGEFLIVNDSSSWYIYRQDGDAWVYAGPAESYNGAVAQIKALASSQPS